MKKLTTFIILILIKPGKFQREDVYDDEFLQSSDQMLRKFWGIQDVTTSVGKLFYYKIPNDAFKGTILFYDVVSEESSTLPKWMIYDKKTAVLEGVPSVSDIGDTRINVKAYDNRGQSVSDMFVIEVYPLWEANTNNKRKCKKGEGVMMIALVIDENLENITPRQKISALKNLAKLLRIPVNTLLFLNAKGNLENNADTLVFDNDVKDKEQNTSIITWQIGCKEKIWAEKLQIVELVEKNMKDGSLFGALQLPIIRWQIASSFNPFRTRRHAGQNENSLRENNKDDPALDENDDEDEQDEPDDEPEGDDESGNILPSSASPVYPEASSTRSYRAELNSLNSSSNKKPIIDSAISNQTYSKNNNSSISPNSTTLPELPEPSEDMDESTETSDLDDDIENISSIPNFSPIPDLQVWKNNLTSSINVTNAYTVAPDKASSQPSRFPPAVKRNMNQIVVEAGKFDMIDIPEDIFSDSEDGNTRNLTLRLIKPEDCVIYAPWIELNSETQRLHILTSLDTISKHELIIEATDSDNMSANTSIIVVVQHPSNARTINFEISLHMKLREGYNLTMAVQLNLLNEIARIYNDTGNEKIVVRNVTCNPFVFTWANKTLPTDHCDNETISSLLNVLTKSPGSMDIKKDLYRDFETNISVIIEKVTWRGLGLCSEIPPPRLPQPEKQNFKPYLRNRIDNITATVGELTVLKIPEDTFFDPDEQNSRNLKMGLFTMDYTPIPPDNWLQFDPTNQEFYGLPMANDVGSTKYQLVCNDNEDNSESMKERHAIEVVVEQATKVFYNVEFRMKLNKSYDEFIKSPLLQRTFVEKLSKLFGDKNTSSIVISGYSPGSLIVTWHNKSLPVSDCVESEIVKLRKILLNDDLMLEDSVNKFLKPEFEAISVDISPIGICEGSLTEVHTVPPEINIGSQEIHAIIFDNAYFINFILPIIIIIVMIFVASLIACMLYRRQRSSAKWTLGDDEKRTYRNKGIPVIFQDELEERLEPTNKSPIIMKEEKPPLPPPEYQKVPPVATTALLSDFDDASYQQGSGTYSRSVERNGHSKQTPIYRKPPPYVPQ